MMTSMKQLDAGGIDSDFGDRLTSVRERQGLSLRGLAQLLEHQGTPMDPSTLNRIEKGKQPAKLREVVAIANAVNVDVLEFMPEREANSHEIPLARRKYELARQELREPLANFLRRGILLIEELDAPPSQGGVEMEMSLPSEVAEYLVDHRGAALFAVLEGKAHEADASVVKASSDADRDVLVDVVARWVDHLIEPPSDEVDHGDD